MITLNLVLKLKLHLITQLKKSERYIVLDFANRAQGWITILNIVF